MYGAGTLQPQGPAQMGRETSEGVLDSHLGTCREDFPGLQAQHSKF